MTLIHWSEWVSIKWLMMFSLSTFKLQLRHKWPGNIDRFFFFFVPCFGNLSICKHRELRSFPFSSTLKLIVTCDLVFLYYSSLASSGLGHVLELFQMDQTRWRLKTLENFSTVLLWVDGVSVFNLHHPSLWMFGSWLVQCCFELFSDWSRGCRWFPEWTVTAVLCVSSALCGTTQTSRWYLPDARSGRTLPPGRSRLDAPARFLGLGTSGPRSHTLQCFVRQWCHVGVREMFKFLWADASWHKVGLPRVKLESRALCSTSTLVPHGYVWFTLVSSTDSHSWLPGQVSLLILPLGLLGLPLGLLGLP